MVKRLFRVTAIGFGLLVALFISAYVGYGWVVGYDPLIVLLFNDTATSEMMQTADRVEALRIDGRQRKSFDSQGAGIFYGCKVLSERVTVDDQTRSELATILTDTDSYMWVGGKACKPQPGVAIRFAKEAQVLDVLFCFECDILEVRGAGFGHFEDFDYARGPLVSIAKRLFPDDAAIQQLDAKK